MSVWTYEEIAHVDKNATLNVTNWPLCGRKYCQKRPSPVSGRRAKNALEIKAFIYLYKKSIWFITLVPYLKQ